MVIVKLLNFNDGIANVRCLPEGKEEDAFTLGLDVNAQTIENNSLGEIDSYVIHAAWKVFDTFMISGEVPESATSIWY